MKIDLSEYKIFSSNFLTEMDLTVYIIRSVRSWQVSGGSIFLACSAAKCAKEAVGSSDNMVSRYFIDRGEAVPATVRIDCVSGSVLRIRMQKGDSVEEIGRLMLAREPVAGEIPAVEDKEDTLVIETAWLTAVVTKNPFNLRIYDKNGNTLYEQYNDDLHSTTNDRRRGYNEAQDEVGMNILKNSYPAFEVYPFGFVENNRTGELCYTEAVRTEYDERFFGFGESFDRVEKSGQEKLIWTVNPLGVSTVKSYKTVPFFFSRRGYGLYLNSPCKSVFDMSGYFFKAYTVSCFDRQLDLFFIYGPDYPAVISGYTELTGKCRNVPPKWSFGVWMGRNCYRTRAEIEEVAKELREKNLPCDVLHLDWDYCNKEETGFDFEFDPARFPDPGGMIDTVKKQGYHLSIWQLPYLRQGYPVYKECAEKGYFAKHEDGSPAERDDVGILDMSNPETVRWYQGKLRKLLKYGVEVIKTDFGENARETYFYHGAPGGEMHNLYPLYYNIAAYEVCEEVCGKDALVWGRSAFAGNQRFPLYWSGDSDSDYLGMYHSLRGGLSIGLSGFPFWSHDVGGYFGKPEPDVYIRWTQLGMLSSHVRFHGTTEREPWHYGEKAVEIYRKYAKLRYSLIEYLYAQAHEAVSTSMPVMRHLVLEFPDDPTVYNIDDQYLLGGSIMIAPVFSKKPSRKVYLPQGRWLDYWSGGLVEGAKWIDCATPLEITPIFLREGKLVPFVPPGNHVDEKPLDEVTLKLVHGNTDTECKIIGKNNITRIHAKTDNGKTALQISCGENRLYRFEICGAQPPRQVLADKAPVAFVYDDKVHKLAFSLHASNARVEIL